VGDEFKKSNHGGRNTSENRGISDRILEEIGGKDLVRQIRPIRREVAAEVRAGI